MHNDGPDPSDPIYMVAARALLSKMREVCDKERDRCGEFAETWPSEIRMFPAAGDTAEGLLYMPRAVPPVYMFQASAGETEDGEIETHILGMAPLTMNLLEMGLDYSKRADQYVYTCTCGHAIPKVISFPLFMDAEDAEDMDMDPDDLLMDQEDKRDPTLPMTADDVRIQEMLHPDEIDYVCPACGFKPNKRY